MAPEPRECRLQINIEGRWAWSVTYDFANRDRSRAGVVETFDEALRCIERVVADA